MTERLPDRTRCIVTWWRGVVTDKEQHLQGDIVDLSSGLAVDLERRGHVRMMPWLARRPRRKGEAIHDPTEAIEERPWWLADELADLLPPPPPLRPVPRLRTVDVRRGARRTC